MNHSRLNLTDWYLRITANRHL